MIFKEDLGLLQSAAATLHIKPNATPKCFKPRPVPYAIRESMELELDRLESVGIVEKVEHSDWATQVVPIPKARTSSSFARIVWYKLKFSQRFFRYRVT